MDELKKLLRNYNFRKHRKYLVYNGVKWLLFSLLLFVLILLLEMVFRLDSTGRTMLFWGYLGTILFMAGLWLVGSVKGLVKRLDQNNYEQLAKELGNKLPDVKDRWINVLQLKDKWNDNPFVVASINQSIHQLTNIRWKNVVQFSLREKRFVLISIGFTLSIAAVLGISQSTLNASKRIYSYEESKESFAPYFFINLDSSLVLYKGESYALRLKGIGKELPQTIQMYNDSIWLGSAALESGFYEFNVSNISKNVELFVETEDYRFNVGTLRVFEPIELVEIISKVDPMDYTGLDQFTIDRLNFRVPEGSNVRIRTEWIHGDSNFLDKEFVAISDSVFLISMGHMETDSLLELKMDVTVIPDEYPVIVVKEDSLGYMIQTEDDYGLSELRIFHSVQGGMTRLLSSKFFSGDSKTFTFSKETLIEKLPKGVHGHLFFEVWDNDGFNGRKATKSEEFVLNHLSVKEEKALAKAANQEYASALSSQKQELNELNEEVAKLEEKIKKGEKLDWNDELKLKQLEEKRQSLLKDLKKSTPDNPNPYSEDILKKQKEIEELRNAVFDEEFLKELEQLKEELGKEDLQSELEKWQQENESIEEALERELEWLKELEFEKLAEDLIEDLKNLSEELDENSLNQWDSLSQELETLDSLNNGLEDPMDLDQVNKEKNETDNSMEKAKESNSKEQIDKAKKSLEELQKTLADTLEQGRDEDVAEDAESLRRILDGLVEVSVDEENIFRSLAVMDETSSNYKITFSKQLEVDRDWTLLKDSLSRLADRQPSVAKIVYEKLGDIDIARDNISDAWQSGDGYIVLSEQQKSMMYYNDLALMLSQVLNSMQMQMNSKKSGKGKCDKPGGAGAKPSKSKMSKMQKGMQQQMEEMLDKNGKSKGEKGKSPGKGKSGSSGKDLMKLAMQQQMIREAMQDAMKGLEGEEAGQGEKLLEDLEEVEEDILNGNVSRETIDKMREIESKLLDFEEAVLEQGEDDKRESSEGEGDQEEVDYEEYFRQQQIELEKLRLEYWDLNGYYDFIIQ